MEAIMDSSNVLWRVSLSNGETFQENQKPFNIIPGELSPWRRLLQYVDDSDLHITSCALFHQNKTYNLHSAGNSPKFSRFNMVNKPESYWVERVLGVDRAVNGQERERQLFTVGIARYKTFDLEVWVDDKNPRNTWTLVKEI